MAMGRYSGKISPSHALWDTFSGQLMDCKKMAFYFDDEINKSVKSIRIVDLETHKLAARLREIWRKKEEYKIPEDQIMITADLYITCLEDILQISEKVGENYQHLIRLKDNVIVALRRINDLLTELLNGMTIQEVENVTLPNLDWIKNNFHPSLFEIPEGAELRERIIGMVEDDERKIKKYKMDKVKRGIVKFCLGSGILLFMTMAFRIRFRTRK